MHRVTWVWTRTASIARSDRTSQAARATRLFGAREEHTFREAATKYLNENQHKRSLERDARALTTLDLYIVELPLQRVHQWLGSAIARFDFALAAGHAH
jgi:hypothetical protein